MSIYFHKYVFTIMKTIFKIVTYTINNWLSTIIEAHLRQKQPTLDRAVQRTSQKH